MPTQRKPEAEAVDCWMRLALAEHYGEAVNEPLPAALLELLVKPEA